MSFWFKKQSEYEEMFELIRRHPGVRPAKLVLTLGVSRSTVLRRLPAWRRPASCSMKTKRVASGPLLKNNPFCCGISSYGMICYT